VAAPKPEVHHAAPRYLLTLHERANGTTTDLDGEGIQAWVEWELEAMRWEGARGDLPRRPARPGRGL
jgi:hypothetical protein